MEGYLKAKGTHFSSASVVRTMANTPIKLILLVSAIAVFQTGSAVDFKCTDEISQHPHYDSCNKYYLCQNQKIFLNTCPVGQRFDAPSRECVEKDKAVCAKRPTTVPPPTTSGGGGITTSCKAPNGNFSQNLCERFVECSNWLAYDKECPLGWLFDEKQLLCLKESVVECGNRIRPESVNDLTTAAETEAPETDPPVTESTGPTKAPYRCTAQNRNHADPDDCAKYIECFNFLAYPRDCPRPTLFDQESLQCVHHVDVNCTNRNRPDWATTLPPTTPPTTTPRPPPTTTPRPPPTTTPKPPPTTTPRPPPTTTPKPPPTTTPRPPPTTTPRPPRTTTPKPTTPRPPITDEGEDDDLDCPEADGLFSHPHNPSKFIQCAGWFPMVHRCPEGGLVFDPEKKVCVWQFLQK